MDFNTYPNDLNLNMLLIWNPTTQRALPFFNVRVFGGNKAPLDAPSLNCNSILGKILAGDLGFEYLHMNLF